MKQLKELRNLLNGLEEHVERSDHLLSKFERQEDCLHHASLAAQLQRGAYVRFKSPLLRKAPTAFLSISTRTAAPKSCSGTRKTKASPWRTSRLPA